MGFWDSLAAIEPNDEFDHRLRKNVIGVLFFPAFFIAIAYSIRLAIVADNPTLYLGASLILFQSLVMLGSYVRLRQCRYVSDQQVLITLWALGIPLAVTLFIYVDFDNKTLNIGLLMLGIMTQMPKVVLFLGFISLQTLVADWNKVHCAQSDRRIVLPGFYTSAPALEMVAHVACSVFLLVAISTFHMQVQESERRGRAQKAANTMTMQVLEHYKKYSTVEVAAILTEYAKEEVVDHDMITLFRAMNANLERYRPFLPNYLFQEDTAAEEEGEEVEGVPSPDSDSHLSSVVSYTDVSSVHSLSPVSCSPVVLNPLENNRLKSPAPGSVSTDPLTLSARSSMSSLFRPVLMADRAVTFALVDIQHHRMPGLSQSSKVAHTFVVNTVYRLAKEARASVHSMLGDSVQLSWNATQAISQSESKAAVFLWHLRMAFLEEANANETRISPAVAAAVWTGQCSVHSITSVTHQLTCVVECKWFCALYACFDLAKRHSVLLMDERTAKGAALSVDSCPVERIHFDSGDTARSLAVRTNQTASAAEPELQHNFLYNFPVRRPIDAEDSVTINGDENNSTIYEIRGEKVRNEDLEWMYQLDRQETTESFSGADSKKEKSIPDLQLAALTAVEDGRYREALSEVDSWKGRSNRQKEAAAATASGGLGHNVPPLITPTESFTDALLAHCTTALV